LVIAYPNHPTEVFWECLDPILCTHLLSQVPVYRFPTMVSLRLNNWSNFGRTSEIMQAMKPSCRNVKGSTIFVRSSKRLGFKL
jgi:hypothetical protein